MAAAASRARARANFTADPGRSMPLQFTTPGELAQARAAGRLAWHILQQLKSQVSPGVTTQSIADTAKKLIEDAVATPTSEGFTFKDETPFPHAVSVCVNDEVMFGMPGTRVLAEGDLVTIDLTLRTELGWCADAAMNVVVGSGTRADRLVTVANAAISTALAHAKPGIWWSEVMAHVAATVGDLGYYLLPGPVGHGIGRSMHEPPYLYAAPESARDVRLRPGMILAIEPVVLEEPSPTINQGPWTVITGGGGWAAFEERMIAVTPQGSLLLTS
jgi:methionyl aminopeptidase